MLRRIPLGLPILSLSLAVACSQAQTSGDATSRFTYQQVPIVHQDSRSHAEQADPAYGLNSFPGHDNSNSLALDQAVREAIKKSKYLSPQANEALARDLQELARRDKADREAANANRKTTHFELRVDGKLLTFASTGRDLLNAAAAFYDQSGRRHLLAAAKSIEGDSNSGSSQSMKGLTSSISIPSIDSDGDRIPDTLEDALAAAFLPAYRVSASENAGTGFSLFKDKPPMEVLWVEDQTSKQIPLVYYRVTPSDFIEEVLDQDNQPAYYRYFRIDYLTLWNRSDGVPGWGSCPAATGIDNQMLIAYIGSFPAIDSDFLPAVQALQPYEVDTENSAVLLAAQVRGPEDREIPSSVAGYRAVRFYATAHGRAPQGYTTNASTTYTPDSPLPSNSHIELYLAQGTHATYFYNPEGRRNFDEGLADYMYDYLDAVESGSPDYSKHLSWVENFFYSCTADHFVDQGPAELVLRMNVGELAKPTPGNHFIQDTTSDHVGFQLEQSIFPDKSL